MMSVSSPLVITIINLYVQRPWRAAPLTHLHLLAGLPNLVVVVDGEHPETPGAGVLVLLHTSLPPSCVTVGSYHRLGGVWRLEIIRHRPGHMIHVVRQLPQSSPHPLLAHPLLGQLETASPEYKANNYHDYERNDNNESVTVHQMMYFSWHIIVTVIMIFMITNFGFVLREIAVSHKYLTISF